jgi:hypothetical protein
MPRESDLQAVLTQAGLSNDEQHQIREWLRADRVIDFAAE